MRNANAHSLVQYFALWITAVLVGLSPGTANAADDEVAGVAEMPSVSDEAVEAESPNTAPAPLTNTAPIVLEARELVDTLDRILKEYQRLQAATRESDDADAQAVAALQARGQLVQWMRGVGELVANVLEQQEQGLDESHFRQKVRKLLWRVDRRLPELISEVQEENNQLRGDLAAASPDASGESLNRIRTLINGNEETLDEAIRFYVKHIDYLDRLELGSAQARASAAESIERRAANLAARLELASQRLEELSEREPGPEADFAESQAQDELDLIAASLWTACDALDALDLPSAAHRRVLILVTGEVTSDVLDTDLLAALLDSALEESKLWIEHRGPVAIGRLARFLGVLAIFFVLGLVTRRATERLVKSSSSQLTTLARQIIVATASRAVMGIGIFLALSQIGVNITALLTGLGIAGFVIGFALQETLGNFASGAMILFYSPFDMGDVIEAAGVMGTVDQMNLVSTTILTFDNQKLVVPNNRIWGNVIRNATAQEERRVDLSFPLSLDVDVNRARNLFEEMCRAHPAVLEQPETGVKIQEVSDEGLLFVVRPWVRTADYWPTYWALNEEAILRLNEAGIQIAAKRYQLEP
jgi:small conductance mechanosensitive channel